MTYELSHGSVFKSPVYRVYNGHKSESGLDLLQRVWISPNKSEMLQHTNKHTQRKGNQHKLIIHSHMYPYKHATRASPTGTPTYKHIYDYMHTYTYTHTHIHANT